MSSKSKITSFFKPTPKNPDETRVENDENDSHQSNKSPQENVEFYHSKSSFKRLIQGSFDIFPQQFDK